MTAGGLGAARQRPPRGEVGPDFPVISVKPVAIITYSPWRGARHAGV